MIKGLAITPADSWADQHRQNGRKERPVYTDQPNPEQGWLVKHQLDEQLRAKAGGQKLGMILNDPELNLRAEYTLFDWQTQYGSGRPVCRRWTHIRDDCNR